MSEAKVQSGGIGFWGLLTIVLIVLKLLGKIDWSWWWVLAPMWIGFLIGSLIFVVAVATSLLLAFKDRL
jgi:hypothetical protein